MQQHLYITQIIAPKEHSVFWISPLIMIHHAMKVISVTIQLVMLLTQVQSARILLLPFSWKSHVFEMSAIGEVLATRGHQLYMVLPPSYPDYSKLKESSIFTIIGYEVKEPDYYVRFPPGSDATEDFLESLMGMSPIQDMRENVEGFTEFCTNILSDDHLFAELKALNLDLAVSDVFPCSRCQIVIPYRLGIPQVALTTTYEPWLFRNPALPSFVPFPYGSGYRVTEIMSFWDRLHNTHQLLDWSYSTRILYISDDFVRPYYKEKPFRSLNKLAGDSKLWLFDTDVVIDYPRPMMPNEVNIGGLSTKPASSLSPGLQKVMDSATNGAIVMSFGSIDVLSASKLKQFYSVFEKLNQVVVMRSTLDITEMVVPENVHVIKWLPQNDILAHNNTRLFITHCGANGQFEALYHAVPMLGFPIFGDQPYNAQRSTYHGFGLHLDLQRFTQDELFNAINTILNNNSYYDNIRRASEIFRSRPLSPRERAAHWVEEVLAGRVDHLQSYALQLEWYQYLMVDILAVVLLCLIIVTSAFCCLVRLCVLYCVHRGATHKLKRQ